MVLALLSDIKADEKRKLKMNDSKTEIILIKSNLRMSVAHKFSNLNVDASTFTC